MRKQKTSYNHIIIAVSVAILAMCILYFTKNSISLQEKMDGNKRIEDKIALVSGNENMNEAVKDCVLALYKLADSKLKRDDKSYKVSEDNADAIYAAYMLGIEDGESWKRKKTYI